MDTSHDTLYSPKKKGSTFIHFWMYIFLERKKKAHMYVAPPSHNVMQFGKRVDAVKKFVDNSASR